MELQEIVGQLARGIEAVDAQAPDAGQNPRTKEPYLPGARSLEESVLVDHLREWWRATSNPDMESLIPGDGLPYEGLTGTKCDFVFTQPQSQVAVEWAVEVKRIQLVGDNGKGNDYGTAKMLSPFLRDRSLFHDVLRLREYPIARRHAAIGYSFVYSLGSCEEALRRHPNEATRIKNLTAACRTNGGELSVKDLLDFTDGIFRVRTLVEGPMAKATFEAWQHPCGGQGVVFGWEVRQPLLSGKYDPRHPL